MSVEKLAPDFKSSALENSGFIGAPTVEAPAMFKRAPLSLTPLSRPVRTVGVWCVSERVELVAWAGRGVYYLLFDRLSCFGPQGSGAVVYTSTSSPMGATRRPPASRPPIAEGECCLQGRTRRRTTSTATAHSARLSWASSSSRRSRPTSFSSERPLSVRTATSSPLGEPVFNP